MSFNLLKLIENNFGFNEKAQKLIELTDSSSIYLKNNLNKTLFKSKCSENFKEGYVVQICSRSSRKALQICSDNNNPKQLIFSANGQTKSAVNYPNTLFVIEKDADGYVSFRNNQFYLNFCDNFSANLLKKSKYKKLLDDTKFVVHEVLGSSELFSLESIKYRGRFLVCYPDGFITTTRNNMKENAHFYLNRVDITNK